MTPCRAFCRFFREFSGGFCLNIRTGNDTQPGIKGLDIRHVCPADNTTPEDSGIELFHCNDSSLLIPVPEQFNFARQASAMI
jgi:hypothetical protein